MYSLFLKDKTVSLVGNGVHQESRVVDVLAHVNRSTEQTDVMYHALDIIDTIPPVKWIVATLPETDHKFLVMKRGWRGAKMERFLELYKPGFGVEFRVVEEGPFIAATKEMGCCPFSGISALIDLLQFDIKSVFITGFDFYRELTNPTNHHIMKSSVWHLPHIQLEWFRKLVQRDSRILVDTYLKELMT